MSPGQRRLIFFYLLHITHVFAHKTSFIFFSTSLFIYNYKNIFGKISYTTIFTFLIPSFIYHVAEILFIMHGKTDDVVKELQYIAFTCVFMVCASNFINYIFKKNIYLFVVLISIQNILTAKIGLFYSFSFYDECFNESIFHNRILLLVLENIPVYFSALFMTYAESSNSFRPYYNLCILLYLVTGIIQCFNLTNGEKTHNVTSKTQQENNCIKNSRDIKSMQPFAASNTAQCILFDDTVPTKKMSVGPKGAGNDHIQFTSKKPSKHQDSAYHPPAQELANKQEKKMFLTFLSILCKTNEIFLYLVLTARTENISTVVFYFSIDFLFRLLPFNLPQNIFIYLAKIFVVALTFYCIIDQQFFHIYLSLFLFLANGFSNQMVYNVVENNLTEQVVEEFLIFICFSIFLPFFAIKYCLKDFIFFNDFKL